MGSHIYSYPFPGMEKEKGNKQKRKCGGEEHNMSFSASKTQSCLSGSLLSSTPCCLSRKWEEEELVYPQGRGSSIRCSASGPSPALTSQWQVSSFFSVPEFIKARDTPPSQQFLVSLFGITLTAQSFGLLLLMAGVFRQWKKAHTQLCSRATSAKGC